MICKISNDKQDLNDKNKGNVLPTASGRLPEVMNGCFVEAKHENPVAERRAALEKLEGRVRVGSGCSDDEEAAVRGQQRLKGGLPPRCRPTTNNWPTAA